MRISTSSRSPESDSAESEPTTTPIKARQDEDEPTLHDLPPAPVADSTTPPPPPPPAPRTESERAAALTEPGRSAVVTPEPVGPKARTSLVATLSLILGVGALALVLSGPLMGWGIGVAGLGLVLSLLGVRATGKRHVAGKTDALLGMLFCLAAIVIGVLALTGSLSWLHIDTPVVSKVREWLDTQFGNRF